MPPRFARAGCQRRRSYIAMILLIAAILAGCDSASSTPTPNSSATASSQTSAPEAATPTTSVAISSQSSTPQAAVPPLVSVSPTLSAISPTIIGVTPTSPSPSATAVSTATTINTNGKTTITSVGSTAMLPLIQEAARQFNASRNDIVVLVDGGGSGAGLTRVAAGEVNIGNSDIYAAERAGIDASALVDHQVCGQGFAIAANKDVTVDNLTEQQAADIFIGKTTNWKQVGGPDLPIKLITRPKGSGTRTTFDRIVLNGGQSAGSVTEANGINLTEDSSATVAKAITDNPGAAGYLGLAYFNTNNAVKKLKYNGVEATTTNIIAGSYAIWSYGHMYTKGSPDLASQAFIDFILSDKFQSETVGKFNYIPISQLKNVKAP